MGDRVFYPRTVSAALSYRTTTTGGSHKKSQQAAIKGPRAADVNVNKWQAQRKGRGKKGRHSTQLGGGAIHSCGAYVGVARVDDVIAGTALPPGLGACEAQPLRFAKALMLIKLIASTCQRQQGQTLRKVGILLLFVEDLHGLTAQNE